MSCFLKNALSFIDYQIKRIMKRSIDMNIILNQFYKKKHISNT